MTADVESPRQIKPTIYSFIPVLTLYGVDSFISKAVQVNFYDQFSVEKKADKSFYLKGLSQLVSGNRTASKKYYLLKSYNFTNRTGPGTSYL